MSATEGVGNLVNWQWLFLLEGIPSVLAGTAVLLHLPEKPANAKWLTPDEQKAVTQALVAENQDASKHSSTEPRADFVIAEGRTLTRA
jgi:hypothetical protein